IEVAVSIDMAFVAVGDDRNLLRRQRHLRGRNVAEFEEASDEATVASGKTNSQPGQAGTFGQGLEYEDILEIRFCDFQCTRRRSLRIDLRIALVAEQQEAEPTREFYEAGEIGTVRHGSLRIGGRSQVERHSPGQEFVGKPVEVGQKTGR